MRLETERKMSETWYGAEPPPMWLRGLVPAYRFGQRLDRWLNLRRRPADLETACIIVVGNLTVGGSGKTPLVIRLCRLLGDAGIRAGVISRGYGRSEKSLRLVSPASDPGLVGDEPLLITQQTGAPVIVAADRCAAARALFKKGVRVVISDDGLQHYRLPRWMEICVIDGGRGFGNGRLLPAGPLRESLARLATVDHIVVNGEPVQALEGITAAGGRDPVYMTLAGTVLRPLGGGQNWRLSQFGGCRVNAVAGIGNPARFYELLRQARIKVIEHTFPDHHAFGREDFREMDPELPVVMTAKDAVKCRRLGLENAWFLSVEAVLPPDWESGVLGAVQACLKSGAGGGAR